MTEKEKLLELLNNSFDEQYNKRGLITAKYTVDYLLDNGVTVPNRGRWIVHTSSDDIWVECSNCLTCGSPRWKVCPVCETRMDMEDKK